MSRTYYTYIVSNVNRTVFYIGVTNNLVIRVLQHGLAVSPGFTQKYRCKDLVYYEEFTDIKRAIAREKQLKNWKRDWKIQLIQKSNPYFKDLSEGWYGSKKIEEGRNEG